MLSEKAVCNIIKCKRKCSRDYSKKNVKVFNLSDILLVENEKNISESLNIKINIKTGTVTINSVLHMGSLLICPTKRTVNNCKDQKTIKKFSDNSKKYNSYNYTGYQTSRREYFRVYMAKKRSGEKHSEDVSQR